MASIQFKVRICINSNIMKMCDLSKQKYILLICIWRFSVVDTYIKNAWLKFYIVDKNIAVWDVQFTFCGSNFFLYYLPTSFLEQTERI